MTEKRKNEQIERMKRYFQNCSDILIRKNTDYSGESRFENFDSVKYYGIDPIDGFVVRTNDKISRINNLLFYRPDVKVKDESIADTLSDFINYLVLLYLYVFFRNREEENWLFQTEIEDIFNLTVNEYVENFHEIEKNQRETCDKLFKEKGIRLHYAKMLSDYSDHCKNYIEFQRFNEKMKLISDVDYREEEDKIIELLKHHVSRIIIKLYYLDTYIDEVFQKS